MNKQEQFTPIGREPSELLALMSEYFAGIHKERDKSRKPYILKKFRTGTMHISFG